MHDVVYDLKRLAERNRDGSFVTQYQRKKILMMCGEQLVQLGWKQMRAHDFKGRHVSALLKLWHEQGIAHATIKNRLASLRWLCEKLDRVSVMPKTNAVYQLEPRPQAATVSKAVILTADILNQIDDPYIRTSLELQAAYGLRRKECLMIKVWQADQGDHLALQDSWTKGSRARTIPLVWDEQREVLDRAKQLVRFKSHSLIPPDLQFHQQRNRYTAWCRKLSLPPLHGLRYAFAIRRFEMLSGFPCPLNNGPHRHEMTPEQRERDQAARLQVSAELGHNRLAIVGLYIGAR